MSDRPPPGRTDDATRCPCFTCDSVAKPFAGPLERTNLKFGDCVWLGTNPGTNVARKAPIRSGKLPNVCSTVVFKTPAWADANGHSLKFPKVEVAGSSPVPRSEAHVLISALPSGVDFLRRLLSAY